MWNINQYPDGSKYVKVLSFQTRINYAINNYDDLWILNQLRDIYRYNKRNATLVITSLIDAQADRRFNEMEPHSLKLVCQFINGMGWENVEVYHPHNPEVVEALIDNVKILKNTEFIENVINSILSDNDSVDLMMLSCDAGGFKPLMKLCDDIKWQGEVYSASKSRDPKTSKLTQIVDRLDFHGKDILIIDDLSVYGGTFLGLSKILKERNCNRLFLAVSHITVSEPNKDLEKYFTKIFTTDSKGLNYNLNNLEVINIF